MPVERTQGGTSLVDVLDRVLDKGAMLAENAALRAQLVVVERPKVARRARRVVTR
jgi:hypothetical protein